MKKEPVEEIEISDYDNMLQPPMESFLHCYSSLNFSFTDFCIKIFLFFEELLSLNFLEKKKEEMVLRKIQKENKRKKKEQMQKTVRSYKSAFLNFNYGETYYELDSDGTRRRDNIKLPKQRFF